MENVILQINQVGEGFCSFVWPMLLQSTVLIVVLYGVDRLIRTRVRAVVRYGLWMLVLVKLVLPPTLSVPTGIGYWVEMPVVPSTEDLVAFDPAPIVEPDSSEVEIVSSQPLPHVAIQSQSVEPVSTKAISSDVSIASEPSEVVTPNLTWQAWVFLVWLAGVLVISVLLLKRLNYVRRLVKQSQPVNEPWEVVIESCSKLVPLKHRVEVRTTEELYSPAACGLFRPVILVPQSIEQSLSPDKLKAVLLHERVHIQRGDLWINLIQTLLQVVYFFHPLLWLANGTIRRLREKAVDETVLTRLGQDDAGPYSDTLIDIAEIAMARPSFTLGLIGVVESEKALADRIKHMVTRPIPKNARVGFIGGLVILMVALVAIPMAQAMKPKFQVVNKGPLEIKLVGVSPDGSDQMYDPSGHPLETKMDCVCPFSTHWEDDSQCRDFIFEVLDVNNQLLFLTFPDGRSWLLFYCSAISSGVCL